MIKGCMFDLDGTILNTLPTITHHGNRIMQSRGLPLYQAADYRRFVGLGSRVLISRMLGGVGITDEGEREAAYRDYVASYDADFKVGTVPYEGMPPLLTALHEGGCRLAVLSNKPASSVELLMKHYFSVPFTHLIGGAEKAEWLKPSPHYANEILADWGISPEECMFVGDSPADVQTARAANIAYPVAVTWGFTDRDVLEKETHLVLDTPMEIYALYLQSAKER